MTFSIGRAVAYRAILSPPAPPVVSGDYEFHRDGWFQQLGAVGFSTGACEPLAASPPSSLAEQAAALAVVVLFQPDGVVTPGFQMSFAASGTLIALYEIWPRMDRPTGRASYPASVDVPLLAPPPRWLLHSRRCLSRSIISIGPRCSAFSPSSSPRLSSRSGRRGPQRLRMLRRHSASTSPFSG